MAQNINCFAGALLLLIPIHAMAEIGAVSESVLAADDTCLSPVGARDCGLNALQMKRQSKSGVMNTSGKGICEPLPTNYNMGGPFFNLSTCEPGNWTLYPSWNPAGHNMNDGYINKTLEECMVMCKLTTRCQQITYLSEEASMYNNWTSSQCYLKSWTPTWMVMDISPYYNLTTGVLCPYYHLTIFATLQAKGWSKSVEQSSGTEAVGAYIGSAHKEQTPEPCDSLPDNYALGGPFFNASTCEPGTWTTYPTFNSGGNNMNAGYVNMTMDECKEMCELTDKCQQIAFMSEEASVYNGFIASQCFLKAWLPEWMVMDLSEYYKLATAVLCPPATTTRTTTTTTTTGVSATTTGSMSA